MYGSKIKNFNKNERHSNLTKITFQFFFIKILFSQPQLCNFTSKAIPLVAQNKFSLWENNCSIFWI